MSGRRSSVSLCLCAWLLLAGCNGVKPPEDKTERTEPGPRPFAIVAAPAPEGAPRPAADEAAALFKIARLDPLKTRDLATLRKVLELPERVFAEYGGFVAVSLYLPGRAEPLVGAAAGGNLAFSTAGATRNALGELPVAELARARVRIDLIPGITPCEQDARMIPGVEGLATISGRRQALVPPDLFLGDKPEVAAYVGRLEKLAGLAPGTWKAGRMYLAKFTSTAFLQLRPNEEPAPLYRGTALAGELSAEACRAAAARGMDWLRRGQRADGSFLYAYRPYADRYEEEKYNVVRHAGAAYSLFAHRRLLAAAGRAADGAPSLAAGEKALAYLKGVAVEDKRFKFTYVPDGESVKLGASALTLVALCERERAGGDGSNRETMNALARFLRAQQTPEGEFLSHYDPARGRPDGAFKSLYYPGEAMLGLLRLYRLGGKSDAALLADCHRAAGFVIAAERKLAADNTARGVRPGQVYPPDAWLMQALEELIDLEDRPEYRAHLFALADGMLAGQFVPVGEGAPEWGVPTLYPDLAGAIDDADPPSAAATGARCEGLVSALRVARRLGEREAAERYARALRLGARFVAQNQYHPYNSYQLPAPEKALGGFRFGPLNATVQIDNVQHCSAFLMELAGALEAGAGRGQ